MGNPAGRAGHAAWGLPCRRALRRWRGEGTDGASCSRPATPTPYTLTLYTLLGTRQHLLCATRCPVVLIVGPPLSSRIARGCAPPHALDTCLHPTPPRPTPAPAPLGERNTHTLTHTHTTPRCCGAGPCRSRWPTTCSAPRRPPRMSSWPSAPWSVRACSRGSAASGSLTPATAARGAAQGEPPACLPAWPPSPFCLPLNLAGACRPLLPPARSVLVAAVRCAQGQRCLGACWLVRRAARRGLLSMPARRVAEAGAFSQFLRALLPNPQLPRAAPLPPATAGRHPSLRAGCVLFTTTGCSRAVASRHSRRHRKQGSLAPGI